MSQRIGCFLIFLGAVLIALFTLAAVAHASAWNYFAAGVVFLVIGLLLWVRSPRRPAAPSGRFRILNNMRDKKDRRK